VGMMGECAREWGPLVGAEEGETDWLFQEVVREGKIVIFGRGEIEVEKKLYATPAALRGAGVDLVHWTEFALEAAPGQLHRAWREEIQGTLTRAGRLGRIYATTTPKGPFGVFHEEMTARFGEDVVDLENGFRLSEDGRVLYGTFDSFANEFLTEQQRADIRSEEASSPTLYQQERRARFVVTDGGGQRVLEPNWVMDCLVGAKRKAKGAVVFGVDVARLGQDWTGFVGVCQDSGGVVRVERYQKLLGQQVVDHIVRLNAEFPGAEFVVDDTGHRGYLADFAPKTIRFRPTQFTREKEKWVGGMVMLLQLRKLEIPDPEKAELGTAERMAIRVLVQELIQYQKIVSNSGGVKYSHPSGGHDDLLDALMMASMDLAAKLRGTVDTRKSQERVAALFGGR